MKLLLQWLACVFIVSYIAIAFIVGHYDITLWPKEYRESVVDVTLTTLIMILLPIRIILWMKDDHEL